MRYHSHKRFRSVLVFLLICSFACVAFSASPNKLVIKAGRIHTITQGVIEKGMILIEGSRIKDVGVNISIPSDADILNTENCDIFPGFIHANSRYGLGNNINAEPDILSSPYFRAVDGLVPFKELYGAREIVACGVTTLYTAPKIWSWKAAAGEGCVFKLVDKFIPFRVLSPSAGMQVDLSFPEIKKKRSERRGTPKTLMGIITTVRKYLLEAQNYMKSWDTYNKGVHSPEKPDINYELEPLVKVLRREMPARIECEGENEIRAALAISEEFNIRVVLERCMEAYKFVDKIKARNIPCIVGPLREGWGKTLKQKFNTFRNPGWLAKEGIKIAIQTENFGNFLTYPRTLLLEAAYAVKYGLDEEEAFKAITINAAQILGVEKRVGSIEIGKDADLVVFSGHPFKTESKVKMVLVDGEIVFKE